MTIEIRSAVIAADPDLLAMLRQIETATIGHILSEGFLPPAIQQLGEGARVCGPAYTVSVYGDDGAILSHAVATAPAGAMLVVERKDDDRHACWGAVMAAAAEAAGLAGVIIDGFVTDAAALKASGVPAWCRGRSAVTTKLRGTAGAINTEITCGGVLVRPGDLVLADENGVCVLNPSEARELALKALAMQEAEPGIICKVLAGARIDELSGARALIERSKGARG